ncbi:hypothetical protein EGH90_04235 [Kaistella haifensis]|nr:hypothetical protein EGH90_04235 [Kaistella haifensis]
MIPIFIFLELNKNDKISQFDHDVRMFFGFFLCKKIKANSFVKKFLILLKIIIFADYNFNIVNY